MTLNEFIADALDKENGFLMEGLDGLGPEELAWQPAPDANSIGWILWHMVRVEDMWIQVLRPVPDGVVGNRRLAREVRPAHPGQWVWAHSRPGEQLPAFRSGRVFELPGRGSAGHAGLPGHADPGGHGNRPSRTPAGDVAGRDVPPDHRRDVPARRTHRLSARIARQVTARCSAGFRTFEAASLRGAGAAMSATPRPSAPAPIAESARITALDLIRGVAVLGILLMNAVAFKYAESEAAYFNLSADGAAMWLDWVVGDFRRGLHRPEIHGNVLPALRRGHDHFH